MERRIQGERGWEGGREGGRKMEERNQEIEMKEI